ncbi:MAG: ESX secretion-associated protein EspG [Actinokineospora sp.]
MLARRLELSVDVLAWLVAWANLGELHRTLAPTHRWHPKSTGHETAEFARATVAELGLVDRRDRLDVETAASLSVLCRPRVEFYGWIHDGARTAGVLAAAIGGEAVFAVRAGGTVWIGRAQPNRLAKTLVDQTPDVRAGRGEPVTVSRLDAVAGIGGTRRTASGIGTRPASAEVRLAHRIAELPLTGSGELHVAVRDDTGRRRQAPRPLRFGDTAHGRWLNFAVAGPGGDDRILLAPAGRPELAAKLMDMRRALR